MVYYITVDMFVINWETAHSVGNREDTLWDKYDISRKDNCLMQKIFRRNFPKIQAGSISGNKAGTIISTKRMNLDDRNTNLWTGQHRCFRKKRKEILSLSIQKIKPALDLPDHLTI